MDRVTYNGHVLRPSPYPRDEPGLWAAFVFVGVDGRGETSEVRFSVADAFRTKEDAIQAALQLGKQIVDAGDITVNL